MPTRKIARINPASLRSPWSDSGKPTGRSNRAPPKATSAGVRNVHPTSPFELAITIATTAGTAANSADIPVSVTLPRAHPTSTTGNPNSPRLTSDNLIQTDARRRTGSSVSCEQECSDSDDPVQDGLLFRCRERVRAGGNYPSALLSEGRAGGNQSR